MHVKASFSHIIAGQAIGCPKVKGGTEPDPVIKHHSGRYQHIGQANA